MVSMWHMSMLNFKCYFLSLSWRLSRSCCRWWVTHCRFDDRGWCHPWMINSCACALMLINSLWIFFISSDSHSIACCHWQWCCVQWSFNCRGFVLKLLFSTNKNDVFCSFVCLFMPFHCVLLFSFLSITQQYGRRGDGIPLGNGIWEDMVSSFHCLPSLVFVCLFVYISPSVTKQTSRTRVQKSEQRSQDEDEGSKGRVDCRAVQEHIEGNDVR